MKSRTTLMLLACLLLAIPAFSQTGPLLAAVVPSDSAVNLYRVNGAELQLVKSIPIPGPITFATAGQLCLNPTGSMLFVGVPGKNGVIGIDLNSQTQSGLFSDENMKGPDGCVVSPDGKKLYVADRTADAVFVFSTGSRKLVKKIPVAKEPRRGLFLPNGKLLVTSGEGEALNVIDPASDTVVRTVKGGVDPRAMAVTPDGQRLAVTNTSGDVLALYKADTLDLIADNGVAKSPQALLIAADGNTLYALGVAEKKVGVVGLGPKHPGRTTTNIPVTTGQPVAMVGPSSAQYLYLSMFDGTLSVIDTAAKTVTAIPGAKGGGALAYRP